MMRDHYYKKRIQHNPINVDFDENWFSKMRNEIFVNKMSLLTSVFKKPMLIAES